MLQKGGASLQDSGSLSRDKMMLFVDMCSVVLQTDECQKRLRESFEKGVVSL